MRAISCGRMRMIIIIIIKEPRDSSVLLLCLSHNSPSVSFVSVVIVRNMHLVRLFQILFDYIIFRLNGNFATGINISYMTFC